MRSFTYSIDIRMQQEEQGFEFREEESGKLRRLAEC